MGKMSFFLLLRECQECSGVWSGETQTREKVTGWILSVEEKRCGKFWHLQRGVFWGEAPAVYDTFLPFVNFTFLLCDLASLLSLFPPFLKQAVHCVRSAEQLALKALCRCVCLSQPACRTTLIPSEAQLTTLPALPPPLFCIFL